MPPANRYYNVTSHGPVKKAINMSMIEEEDSDFEYDEVEETVFKLDEELAAYNPEQQLNLRGRSLRQTEQSPPMWRVINSSLPVWDERNHDNYNHPSDLFGNRNKHRVNSKRSLKMKTPK
ncbi:hypothetical protein EVAR_70257_1 [Eumeta japonica]|uniref:Uncharacterized protein n=1 Tax=Eumeta variegata TaxID=151549 RepID=A0A4C1SB90_EUMVA|nr:hypothetical protein EVAR_70257_1 [Eumeta japonica]